MNTNQLFVVTGKLVSHAVFRVEVEIDFHKIMEVHVVNDEATAEIRAMHLSETYGSLVTIVGQIVWSGNNEPYSADMHLSIHADRVILHDARVREVREVFSDEPV